MNVLVIRREEAEMIRWLSPGGVVPAGVPIFIH